MARSDQKRQEGISVALTPVPAPWQKVVDLVDLVVWDASLGALPLSINCWYLRLRSALNPITARRVARPLRIIS